MHILSCEIFHCGFHNFCKYLKAFITTKLMKISHVVVRAPPGKSRHMSQLSQLGWLGGEWWTLCVVYNVYSVFSV